MKLRFIFEDDNEFATFELRRLSYDVGTGIEIKSSDEDADDLLLLSLTDDLSPDVFAGLAWAVNNRPVRSSRVVAPGLSTLRASTGNT